MSFFNHIKGSSYKSISTKDLGKPNRKEYNNNQQIELDRAFNPFVLKHEDKKIFLH